MTDPTANAGSLPPQLAHHAGVLLEPQPRAWKHLVLDSWRRARANPAALALRSRLGLPADRPVIMSGHQALFWHPGILAKWFALHAAAQSLNAAPAWVVVDHDTEDPTVLHYPAPRAGITTRAAWQWTSPLPPNVPPCSLPARLPDPLPADAITAADAAPPLERTLAALRRHAHAPSLAVQVTAAAAELIPAPAPAILYSSQLLAHADPAHTIDHLRADPAACVKAYNAAVALHPRAGLRPLAADESADHWELPLWRCPPRTPRQRVFAEELASIPHDQLAPRAILLTAMLRALACDLFIHGLGGGLYDPAGQEWWRLWRPRQPLAATAVASATLHLRSLANPSADPARAVARARWLAHHARHNPADTQDPQAQLRKLELLQRLRSQPRRSAGRRAAFEQIHALLADHARRAEPSLARLRQQAADAAAAARSAVEPTAREWPFVLYPAADLEALRSAIAAEIPAG